MQNTSDESRRLSPFLFQSGIGLTILVSLGLLGALIMWLTNFTFRGRSFRATLVFPNAGGMTVGTMVNYRGVEVGEVVAIKPEPEGVALEVEITPADLLIPADSLVEATQAGLVGETSIDITPRQPLPAEGVKAMPLDPDCNPKIIICNQSRLQGEGKPDINILIRSLVRISDVISEPQVANSLPTLFQKSSVALDEFNDLSKKLDFLLGQLEAENTVTNLNSTLKSLDSFSERADGLLAEAEAQKTIEQLNATLNSLEQASEQIREFMVVNQDQMATTVTGLGQVSKELAVTLDRLNPLITEFSDSQFIENLDTISVNAVELTANLKDFSSKINDPQTINQLKELLDSTGLALESINTLTDNLDQVIGDPELRNDLIQLIRGLSQLFSYTEQLQQQIDYAHLLNQIVLEMDEHQLSE